MTCVHGNLPLCCRPRVNVCNFCSLCTKRTPCLPAWSAIIMHDFVECCESNKISAWKKSGAGGELCISYTFPTVRGRSLFELSRQASVQQVVFIHKPSLRRTERRRIGGGVRPGRPRRGPRSRGGGTADLRRAHGVQQRRCVPRDQSGRQRGRLGPPCVHPRPRCHQ
jgi:hypothetical protein